MRLELVKLAVANAADESEVAILSVVQEGAEGATRQVFTTEPVEAVIGSSQKFFDVHDNSVAIAGLGTSANASVLKGFIDNQTRVLLTGYTMDGHVLYGTGYVSYRAGFAEIHRSDIVQVTTRGTSGYDSTGRFQSGIDMFTDLLGEYNVSQGDGNTIYGWSVTDPIGSISTSESGGVQTVTKLSNPSLRSVATKRIFFPFGGISLRASINVLSATGSGLLLVAAYDALGAAISTVSTPISSTGLLSLDYTLPNTVSTVQVGARPGSVTGNQIVFSSPSLLVK